ncbi:MAG: ATP-binding protein [Chloroflexi bacterium]|nr:ATP-binding protein [Chloroflexota bacterium]
MEDLTTLTIIIGLANLFAGTVSAALFLLIFWQRPENRLNQLFGGTMLALTIYSIANILSRLPSLGLDPDLAANINSSMYLVFVVGLFLSSIRFADIRSTFIRRVSVISVIAFFVLFGLIWSGAATDGVVPVPDRPGTYEAKITPIGRIAVGITFLYPLVTTVILYRLRHRANRLKDFWQAPALVVFGIIWLVTLWPFTYIPLNAIALAGAAFLMGRAVLRENLFNPLTDITNELKIKNRELRDADRVKNQFLAKMSHELRTPLNSIIGYTDLVLDGLYGDLNEQQKDRLEKVLRNGRNLLNLINDILDLSHIEIGQIDLYPEPVSSIDLLENVLAVVEPQLSDKEIKIIRDFEAAPPIYVDKMRAQQIMTNIVSNAVKFTNQGSIRISAHPKNGSVQFEIEDTGIGIPEDKRHRVFEEFRQIDNAPTREYGGTGLGMSITKKLVQMSGGDIWLESELNKGTTFFVTLPNANLTSSPRKPALDDRKLTVLVIDDTQDSRMYLHDSLAAEKPDWQLITAEGGREGLDKAQSKNPDVITLDIMMPSMDGWEVLKRLKANDATKAIPVVIVSHVDNHDLAYKLGATAILSKPVNRKLLAGTLERVAHGEDLRPETYRTP